MQVWDTNRLEVVVPFALPARVYAVALSPVASSHCLVAVGTGDPQVTHRRHECLNFAYSSALGCR